jgi:glutathione S-transferase
MSAALTLIGRSSSHYSRVVRLLAHALDVPLALSPVFDLMSEDATAYAGNPALKLPALRDGEEVLWGSGNACRRVAARAADGGARVFWPEHATTALLMNAHEMVAHAMATQVEVVFHELVSKRPADATSRKRRASLIGSLHWLDAHWPAIGAELPAGRIALIELQLFALLEHLRFRYPPDAPLDYAPTPHLDAFVAEFRQRPAAQATEYRFDSPPA